MTRNEAIFQLNATVDHIRGDVAYDASGDIVTVDLSAAQTLADSKAYVEQRVLKYPSIQEQLDMQYWDSVNGTTTWKDAIATVKTENPKP